MNLVVWPLGSSVGVLLVLIVNLGVRQKETNGLGELQKEKIIQKDEEKERKRKKGSKKEKERKE